MYQPPSHTGEPERVKGKERVGLLAHTRAHTHTLPRRKSPRFLLRDAKSFLTVLGKPGVGPHGPSLQLGEMLPVTAHPGTLRDLRAPVQTGKTPLRGFLLPLGSTHSLRGLLRETQQVPPPTCFVLNKPQ